MPTAGTSQMMAIATNVVFRPRDWIALPATTIPSGATDWAAAEYAPTTRPRSSRGIRS